VCGAEILFQLRKTVRRLSKHFPSELPHRSIIGRGPRYGGVRLMIIQDPSVRDPD
jgi:hypothetical protein